MKKLALFFPTVGLASPPRIPFPHAVIGGGQRKLLYFNGLTITNEGDETFEGPGEILFELRDEGDRFLYPADDYPQVAAPQLLRNFRPLAPGESIRVPSWIFNYVDVTDIPNFFNFSCRVTVGQGEWTTSTKLFLRRDIANVDFFDWSNLTTEVLKLQARVAALESRP